MTRKIKLSLRTRIAVNIVGIIISLAALYFSGYFLNSVAQHWLDANAISNIESQAEYYGWTDERKEAVDEIKDEMDKTAKVDGIYKWSKLSSETVTGIVIRSISVAVMVIIAVCAMVVLSFNLKEWFLFFGRRLSAYLAKKSAEAATKEEKDEEDVIATQSEEEPDSF